MFLNVGFVDICVSGKKCDKQLIQAGVFSVHLDVLKDDRWGP